MEQSRWHDKLAACGQGHVFEHWATLSADEQAALEKQVEELDSTVRGGFESLMPTLLETLQQHEEGKTGAIESMPAEWLGKADGSDPKAEAQWEELGFELVAKNCCAACVLAGGMGTRLGHAFPKGMLGDPETKEKFLPSEKSIFQVQAERILTIQRQAREYMERNPKQARVEGTVAAEPVVWFLVMTGPATHKMIVDFFERRQYFGLRKEQVLFFEQGLMPCFAYDGKVLMETAGRIATSVNGNAGIYPAMQQSGVLAKLKAAGVRWVQVFSVDNVLVRVADPVWYGYCEATSADVVVKSVPKRDWSEAVGVLTLRGGKAGVIEYSEIGEARAQEKLESGELRYNAANICLQAYRLDFLEGPVQDFKPIWHVAKKDIATINGKVPGIKLEVFIFDVFEAAKTFRLLQVDRGAEFSAIKNASDSGKNDTPHTALKSLSRLHRQWLRQAGAKIPEDGADGSGPVAEVSPLVSFRGEGLEALAAAVDGSADPIVVQ